MAASAHGQVFLKNGLNVGPIDSIRQLPAAQENSVVNDKAIDLGARLGLEHVQSVVSVANQIAAKQNVPASKALRDLITASNPNSFNGTIGTLGPFSNVALVSPKPNVEALSTFQANVNAAFSSQATQPGLLRVWNGTQVRPPDPYPDTVVVVGNNALCTGTLITPQHVITAAHCFCDKVTDEVSVGTSLLNVQFRSKVDLSKSFSHIACNKITGDQADIGQGDVALYTLVTPFSGVATRRISTEASLRAVASVRAVGFGVTSTNQTGVKFTVDIVIASYDCSAASVSSGNAHCTPDVEMIAAGMNRDTCNGDSGGPLYVLGQDLNLYLAAVTSRALDPTGNCGDGGIYAKLTTPQMHAWLVSEGVPDSVFEH